MPGSMPLWDAFNVNRRLYASALSSRYMPGQFLYDVDLGLASDPDIYEKLRRDPVIAAAMDQLLFEVASKPPRCVPSDAEDPESITAARIMDRLLSHIIRFQEARYELAQAVILSSAFAEIQTERRRLSLGGRRQSWLVPVGLKDIDRRRWYLKTNHVVSPTGEKSLQTYWTVWDLMRQEYVRVEHPEWFVKFIYDDSESRLGYGRGLVEALVLFSRIKGRVLQEGLAALERWAQGGVLVVKIDDSRVGSSDRTTDQLMDEALTVWKSIRSRHVAGMGKEDEVQLLEPSGTGHQMVMEFLRYIDESMVKLILGSTAPMGGGKGDKFRDQAEVEQDSTDLRVRFVREGLDEALTRDVVGLIWRQNYSCFYRLGLGDAGMPRLTSVPEPRPDPERTARIISVIGGIMPFKRDEVYSKLGMSVPLPGEPTVGGPGSRLTPENLRGFDFQHLSPDKLAGSGG